MSYPITLLSKYLHRRMGADPKRFSERLGHGTPMAQDGVLWFHAASLGEVRQIGPLAQTLHHTTGAQILVTTTTATGADWVANNMPFAVHRFAPLDTPRAVKRFLNLWPIKGALFVEGEFGPRMVRHLHKRGVAMILLNARHSRTRARFGAVFASLLGGFCLITCRSAPIAADMAALGLDKTRVHVLPDLRLTLPALQVDTAVVQTLGRAIGARPLWLAASTHADDEAAVLAAHQSVLKSQPDALLIIAPRHPARGAPLCALAQSRGLAVAQRSSGAEIAATTQIYVADTLGELGALYTLAPIAFLGGSWGTEGGHTPYEPAVFDTAILHGPHVKNFDDAYAALADCGATKRLCDPADLGGAVANLMHGAEAQAMAQAGKAFMHKNQDGLTAYIQLIAQCLPHDAGPA